jgi:alpha-L-fucosidase
MCNRYTDSLFSNVRLRGLFMKWLCKALAIGATSAMLSARMLGYQNFMEVKPSPQQVAWQDLEFGVIVHFSTNTFLDRE